MKSTDLKMTVKNLTEDLYSVHSGEARLSSEEVEEDIEHRVQRIARETGMPEDEVRAELRAREEVEEDIEHRVQRIARETGMPEDEVRAELRAREEDDNDAMGRYMGWNE